MNYQKFKTELKERLEKKLADQGIQVILTTITKNNGYVKEVLTFKQDNYNGTPAIHLKELFATYEDCQDYNQIIAFVLQILESKAKISVDSLLGNWEEVKARVEFRVINYEWNQEQLADTVHKRFLNFAVVPYLNLYASTNEKATVTIRKEFLDIWNIDEAQLWEAAYSNLQKESIEVKTMLEVISELLENEIEVGDEDGMFVLSNANKIYGARGILREDVLEAFADKYKRSFYILPSSVHEVLIVLEKEGVTKEYLNEMVRTINHAEVSRNEQLADEVLYYNYETRELVIA